MARSIKDFWYKIKSFTNRVLEDRDSFYALLLISVGVVSFGLGKMSVVGETISRDIPTAQNDTRFDEKELEDKIEAISSVERYVGSKNSDKYHLPWCSGAQRISDANKVWFSSKEEAEKAGYVPASNCEGI